MVNMTRRSAIALGTGAVAVAGLGVAGGLHLKVKSVDNTPVPVETKSFLIDYVRESVGLVSPAAAVGMSIADTPVIGHMRAKVLVSDEDWQSIDELWANSGHVCWQSDCYIPVYGVDSLAVACVAPQKAFGKPGCELRSATVTEDNDLGHVIEGTQFDYENGLLIIPRKLFDENKAGWQVQLLTIVNNPAEFTCEVSYDIRVGSQLIFSGVVFARPIDGCVVIPLDCVDSVAKDGIAVGVDGIEQLYLVDGVAVRLDTEKCSISLPFDAMLVDGLHVYIKENSSIIKPAFAIESADMLMWPFGKIDLVDGLTAGHQFEYTGKYIFPNNWVHDIYSLYGGFYSQLYQYLYGYWGKYGEWSGGAERNVMGTAGMTWGQVKDLVYDGPNPTDEHMSELRQMSPSDPQQAWTVYYGQFMLVPGADDTSGYTFMDKAYWSSILKDYHELAGHPRGSVPAFCLHTNAEVSAQDWDVWQESLIYANILDVKATSANNGYIVLGLNTKEYQRNPNTTDRQGAGLILKIPYERPTGFLKVKKEFSQ